MRLHFIRAAFVLTFALANTASATERVFTSSALAGVWEPVAFESFAPRNPRDPESKPNCKYCFTLDEAYPCLSADSKGDSADGGGPYFLVDGDILVIRTGVPGALYAFQIHSLTGDKLIWQDGSLRVTLRRVAKVWNPARAPIVKPKLLPVTYAR